MINLCHIVVVIWHVNNAWKRWLFSTESHHNRSIVHPPNATILPLATYKVVHVHYYCVNGGTNKNWTHSAIMWWQCGMSTMIGTVNLFVLHHITSAFCVKPTPWSAPVAPTWWSAPTQETVLVLPLMTSLQAQNKAPSDMCCKEAPCISRLSPPELKNADCKFDDPE